MNWIHVTIIIKINYINSTTIKPLKKIKKWNGYEIVLKVNENNEFKNILEDLK